MNQKLTIFKEILIRVKNESPSLFKKLQLVFFGLSVIDFLLLILSPILKIQLTGLDEYLNLNTVLVLLSLGGVSMLPVENSSVLIKKSTSEEEGNNGEEEDGTGGENPTKPPTSPAPNMP